MISLFTLLIIASSLFVGKADNPFAQTCYTADPAPYVWNETLYVYTGHDKDGSKDYDMIDWQCFSTKDLQNWENHGTVLSTTDFSWANAGTAWASQLIERNGKFYYYVTLTSSARAIGVAVGDSPIGPFKDALGKPLAGPDWNYIDPTVWIDDDGQAWLMWGNPKCYYVKLNEDMISFNGGIQQMDMGGLRSYVEGPWFYKRKDKYYLVYAAMGNGENIQYATANSPTGPWNYGGVVMPDSQQGSIFTNHPGVIDYKDKSFFFYHNGRLPGGGSFTRSVCVEGFEYGSDGSIPKIMMSNEGPKQLEPFDPYRKVPGTTICFSKGVKVDKDNGKVSLGYIQNGSYVKLRGVDFGDGASKFIVSAGSETSGGKIEIKLDKSDGTSVGSCTIEETGGWHTWKTFECDVKGAEGSHDLFLVFSGGDGFLFNLDWWQFE